MSTVVSDVFGVAGIKILDLIADGTTRADVLTASVRTRIKRMEDVKKALTNCLTTEHCFVIGQLMTQYRDLKARIKTVETELYKRVEPYGEFVKQLDEIPGIDEILAIGIIAEASTDMSSFKDERSFAAWSGVASGNNESAGKKKDLIAATAIPRLDDCSSKLRRELPTVKDLFTALNIENFLSDLDRKTRRR